MKRPAIMNLALPGFLRTVDRRLIGLGLIALLTLPVGYIGQSSWGVGVSVPSAANAIVTDVVGGAGSRKPVRAKVSMAISNNGTERIRVIGRDSNSEPGSNGKGTEIMMLTPSRLIVEPGTFGRMDADVMLDCDRPEPLRLPDLQLDLRDGRLRELQVGGSGMLLEACSRAQPAVRPLTASTLAAEPMATATDTATDDVPLAVRFASPTGRPIEVLVIRAGGVQLQMPATPTTVADKTPVIVHLTAPKSCPAQWQIAGIPSALTIDIRQSQDAESTATVRLRLGPALTSWLLATSCKADQ